jgi:hypothetical protein
LARLVHAAEFATEGEARAAEALRLLPDEWIVICNKTLVTRNARSFEIDFLVLGDHCVFAIDEKSWRGRIHGSDQIWVRADGSSESSPLNKIEYVAVELRAGHPESDVFSLALVFMERLSALSLSRRSCLSGSSRVDLLALARVEFPAFGTVLEVQWQTRVQRRTAHACDDTLAAVCLNANPALPLRLLAGLDPCWSRSRMASAR